MSKEPKRFKQTEIGELPEEWEIVRLGELAIINPAYPLQRGKEYAFIPMEALDENFPKVKFIQKRTWEGGGSRFKYGDVLLARITPSAENGKTAVIDFLGPHEFGFGSTEFIVFSPKTEITTSLYIYYLLKWSNIRNRLISQMTGTTGRQRIPNDAPYYVFVPLPPLEEQKRIAGVLRLVDKTAEETKRIINIYEKAKKFALKHLLTRGIGHTRFKQTEIGELPEEWEVKPLSETLLDHQSGEWGKDMKEFNPNLHEPMRIVRSTEFTKNCHLLFETAVERAIPKKKVEKILLKEGDILVERSGGGPKQPVGRVVFVERLPEGNWGFSNFIQRLRVKFEYHPRYIWAVLYWHWLRGSVLAMQEQTTGIRNLRWSDYLNLPIPLPPLEEQKQIADMLSTIDAAIENERKYLRVLEKCKKWLLDNLLTGKVRLPPEVDEILKGVLPDAL